jgi:hypothetical protein
VAGSRRDRPAHSTGRPDRLRPHRSPRGRGRPGHLPPRNRRRGGIARLAEAAVDSRTRSDSRPGLGPDDELTLSAGITLSTSLHILGFPEGARALNAGVLERMRNNPHSVPIASSPCPRGRRARPPACAMPASSAAHWNSAGTPSTGSAGSTAPMTPRPCERRTTWRSTCACSVISAAAHQIDEAAVHTWRRHVNEYDNRLLFAQTNLARDLYGLGRYSEALAVLQRVLPRSARNATPATHRSSPPNGPLRKGIEPPGADCWKHHQQSFDSGLARRSARARGGVDSRKPKPGGTPQAPSGAKHVPGLLMCNSR